MGYLCTSENGELERGRADASSASVREGVEHSNLLPIINTFIVL